MNCSNTSIGGIAPVSPDNTTQDWERCARIIQHHSEDMVFRWKSEIDMLLVFAGLFSAVLTAFNVESYKLLQPDPDQELLITLKAMSAQLNGYTFNPPFVNSTAPVSSSRPFVAARHVVWLNALWFSALVCTLSASYVAIMRQWLHQYSSGLSGTSRETARLRQYRYESVQNWRVPEIVVMLPVLLQLALVLFLAGLLILLWNLYPSVALAASILIGILLTFTILTTVIPAVRADCCYQSAQVFCFFLAVQYTGGLVRLILEQLNRMAYTIGVWREGAMYSVCWSVMGAVHTLRHRLGTWGMFNTWEIREKHEAHIHAADLDFTLLQRAYETTLDDSLLDTVMTHCVSDIDPLFVLQGCVTFLHNNTTYHGLYGPVDPENDPSVDARYAQGSRRARYQIYLFSQVLRFLPVCAQAIGPVGHKRTVLENVARKALKLLPPELHGRRRYVSYHEMDTSFETSHILRSLSKLVGADILPAEAFLKLVVNVRVLDSRSGGRLRRLNISDIQLVAHALPIHDREVERTMDWDCGVLAADFIAAVTTLMHRLLEVRACSPTEDHTLIEQSLHRIASSIAAVLSHPSWNATVARRQRMLNAICLNEAQWEITHHLPFLPTLLRVCQEPMTSPLPIVRLADSLQGAKALFDQDVFGEHPSGIPLEDKYGVLTQALTVLEGLSLSATRDTDTADELEEVHFGVRRPELI